MNGVSILLNDSYFTANTYGSWNRSLSDKTRLDLGVAGAALELRASYLEAMAHSHQSREDTDA